MSTFDVNRRAKDAVVQELGRRGGVILSEGPGRQPIRAADKARSRTISIEVHGKRSGDWQTMTTKGSLRTKPVDETEFWILVDLAGPKPVFFVFEGWWMRNDIHREHADWLSTIGGSRPVSPDSTHHAIRADRAQILAGLGQWSRLGIFA